MEFSELIQKRLTTLKYTNKKVSIENINKIIDSAIISPSAKNRQPWRFYILTDEQKNYIADKMNNWINNTGLQTTIKRSADIICGVAFGYKSKEPVRKGRYKKEYLVIGEKNERKKFCK